MTIHYHNIYTTTWAANASPIAAGHTCKNLSDVAAVRCLSFAKPRRLSTGAVRGMVFFCVVRTLGCKNALSSTVSPMPAVGTVGTVGTVHVGAVGVVDAVGTGEYAPAHTTDLVSSATVSSA